MKNNEISLRPTLILRILGAVGFLLVLSSIAGQLTFFYITKNPLVFKLALLFSVDHEHNFPTFFSTLLLLIAAVLLLFITVLEKKRKASDFLYWAVLSFGFLYLAIDELASLHEKLSTPTRILLRTLMGDGLGVFYYGWPIVGIAFICVVALYFMRFWLGLPAKTRLRFLIAFILFITGAIGFEMIEGYYDELYGRVNFVYSMIATVEESLEMAGVIIFIWALMVYIADNFREIRLRFEGVSFASAISMARSQAVLGNAPDVPELSLDSQFVQLDNQELKVSTSSRDD